MNWFCIHTRPAKEDQAARYCRDRLGVETYFPRLRRQKTIRRVRRDVTSPLFPRYFFCRLDAGAHYRAVRYAPEIIDIVSFGGRPAIVDDGVVENLRLWAGETLDVISIGPGFQAGDHVRITDGPLRGLEAVVQERANDPERVAVLLSILSCGARLTICPSALERIA